MRAIHDSAEMAIIADPRSLFDIITDLGRLPEWNGAIEKVIDRPPGVSPGATWTVQMHPARLMRWRSVSTLEKIDPERMRFSYRTVNADGNPSYALWHWEVTSQGARATVSVRWDVCLETLDRQLLGGPVRRRQLRKEVAASLGRDVRAGRRLVPTAARIHDCPCRRTIGDDGPTLSRSARTSSGASTSSWCASTARTPSTGRTTPRGP